MPVHASPSTATPLAVQYRPRSSLKPDPRNARTHPRRQLRKIVASLKEFGWTNPIIIDEDNSVLCGHGRLLAAEELGVEQVPTITLSHLSEEQRRAYIIADNAIADKSGWSRDLLRSELQGLIEIGYDVELTGFDTLEIDTLLSLGTEEPEEEEGVELPDGSPPVTRPGDHWVIGHHHLLCADARAAVSYEALLGDELAELVFTDPPYNVPIAGNVSGLGKKTFGEFVMASGEMGDAEFAMQFLRPVLRNIARFSAPGAIGMVCMDWRGSRHLLDAADGVLEELKNLIVWVKSNAGMGAFYRSQHELIHAFKISKGPTQNNFGLGEGGRHRSNVWPYPGVNSFRRGRKQDLEDHPTCKPRKLVADAILDCSRRGGIILDPFLGSGTTLAAAADTGRRGYGLELDPAYCDVILRRLQQQTGAVAQLIDGTPFADVAAARRVHLPEER
jgi:DNA modification methylase